MARVAVRSTVRFERWWPVPPDLGINYSYVNPSDGSTFNGGSDRYQRAKGRIASSALHTGVEEFRVYGGIGSRAWWVRTVLVSQEAAELYLRLSAEQDFTSNENYQRALAARERRLQRLTEASEETTMTDHPPEMTDEEVHALFDAVALRCPECGHNYTDEDFQGEADWSDDLTESYPDAVLVSDVLAVAAVAPRQATAMLVAIAIYLKCPECSTDALPAPTKINHLDEYVKARRDVAADFEMVAQRVPELRPRLEAMLAEADAIATDVLRFAP